MCGIILWMATGRIGRLVAVCSTCKPYMKTMGLPPQPRPAPAVAGEVPPVRPVIDELTLVALEAMDID
jgi:hypothetical protein